MSPVPSDPPFRRGDFVIIGADGREVRGMVGLASENGRSLMLLFDAMIGGWVGAMPVLEEGGTWRALNNMPITVRRASRDDDE